MSGSSGVCYSAGPMPLVLAMTQILSCLKKHGQRLDSELAEETGVPIAKVRQRLGELAATGAVITCNVTRYEQGKRIDGLVGRLSGWVPPPAPGRKAKVPA
jgi:transcription initiation factor IIE alpha subunit